MMISRIMGSKNFEFLKDKAYRRIGMGQLVILRAVLDDPGIYADDICKMFELDKATVAVSIKHLMMAGYIRREVDPDDGRKKRLLPTDKLLEAAQEMEKQVRKQVEIITEGFSEKDIEVFGNYLDRIKENMSKA